MNQVWSETDPDLKNPDSHLVIYLWAPHTDRDYNTKLAWLNVRQSSSKGGECLKKWVWVMNNNLETDGERIGDKREQRKMDWKSE